MYKWNVPTDLKTGATSTIDMDDFINDRLESIQKIKNVRCRRGAASELADQIVSEFQGGNRGIDRDEVRSVRRMLLEIDRDNFIIGQLNWVIHA
jgi:hypothetical protein